jgi:CheY-like chemotaxis protein
MARVLALVPDLLFGSRVQGSLEGAGHEVELIGSQGRLLERLADPQAPPAAVLVVDLTDASLDGASILASLTRGESLASLRTIAFYAHVDGAVRERAEAAGFDLVVPRSRMNREGARLLEQLLAGAGPPE